MSFNYYAVILVVYSICPVYSSILPSAYIVNVTQKVDHFSFADARTFQQRLIISHEFWRGDGYPIVIGIGGESNIQSSASRAGFIWQNAPRLQGLIVFIEHRYYGGSLPFRKYSFDRKLQNYKYLTVEQALQDAIVTVQWVKDKFNATSSPVIAIGGSYGGALAAWLRVKFPHAIDMSLSSSAPVLQFPGQYGDCRQYYDTVTQNYRDYGKMCAAVIKNSWAALRRIASRDISRIHQIFKLCPSQELTVDDIIDNLRNSLEFMAMTDYPNESNLLTPLPPYPISHFCRHCTNANSTDEELVTQLADGLAIYFNYTGSTVCNSFTRISGTFRGYSVQQCTEMIHPYCCDSERHIFEKQEWNLQKYKEECFQKYGLIADDEYIVRTFGGRKYIDTDASRIIFSNGLRDPIAAGSVLSSPNRKIAVLTMSQACHHEDLSFQGDNDPLQLIKMREKQVRILQKWIEQVKKRRTG